MKFPGYAKLREIRFYLNGKETTVEVPPAYTLLETLRYVLEGAVQCGHCTPGIVVAAYHLLKEVPRPTEEVVREALRGNLCRCTGYVKIVRAVLKAAGE